MASNLSSLTRPSMELRGIQNPPRDLGTHPLYQEYLERAKKAGIKPMTPEDFSRKQRE